MQEQPLEDLPADRFFRRLANKYVLKSPSIARTASEIAEWYESEEYQDQLREDAAREARIDGYMKAGEKKFAEIRKKEEEEAQRKTIMEIEAYERRKAQAKKEPDF